MQRGAYESFFLIKGQVVHSLKEQRKESWLLHLSGVWRGGYFPPSFLHFFSISGTKLIKIMCSKIIFGFRLTNWYKFQSDSDRSFHFAKSAKGGACVSVCYVCVGKCTVRAFRTSVKLWPFKEELAGKCCVFRQHGGRANIFMYESISELQILSRLT